MREKEIDLLEFCGRLPRGIIALTGGGGKTSLLFALARAAAARGDRMLCTTTTKMHVPVPEAWLRVQLEEDPARLTGWPEGALFAARPPAASAPEKALGYTPEQSDALFARGLARWMAAEADGAAGRPVKAPAAHEPVIPSRTAAAAAVIGMGCMGKPLDGETAFRLPEFAAVTGLRPGDPITPEAAARLAAHPQGGFKNVPSGAARLLICNQTDLPGGLAAARQVAAAVWKGSPGCADAVLAASVLTKGTRCLLLTP